MFARHELIPSKSMGRRMHLWRYGQFGAPLVVFPSAAGFAHEWQAHGMLDELADLVNGGRIKVYCTETNVAEAWTRRENDPAWRIQRHLDFEQYVLSELVPFIRHDCQSEGIPLAAAGCSLGAWYSVNFALKQPEVFRYALGMSGRYDITDFTHGFSSPDVYFNNPMAYVPGLTGDDLERVRAGTRLVLVCGQGKWEDGNVDETRKFAALLAEKQIPHQEDIWGHDVAHEWVWWRRQARHHLVAAFGGD